MKSTYHQIIHQLNRQYILSRCLFPPRDIQFKMYSKYFSNIVKQSLPISFFFFWFSPHKSVDLTNNLFCTDP